MIIAQISDMHIQSDRRLLKDKYDNAGNLERCIAQLNAVRPDLVLATGDLVNSGLREEYVFLRELLLPLQAPLYLLPGNHDDRALMRELFAEHAYLQNGQQRLHYVIEADGLRIIMLDTLIPGSDEGAVGEAQLAWLDEQLERAAGQPVIIGLHHPPFATGPSFMDNRFCADGPQLERLIARYPNVLRVVCGHLHRSIQVNYAGTVGCLCPSTAVAFGLSFSPKSPLFPSNDPTGYYFHLWARDKPMITHTALLASTAR